MKVSIDWLKDFTAVEMPAKQLCDGMTMSGSKVEGCETLGAAISGVISGRITAIAKHPDADKLLLCRVDTGDQVLQIVTGAKNVNVGDIVPVALDGATLPGGVTIHSGQLRGQLSEGMLCSVTELNCTIADFPDAAADGIFVLPANTPIGRNILDVLQLNDTVIEFEITSNRVDCFAVEGLGRETAVTFNQKFTPVTPQVRANCAEQSADLATVAITAPDLCYRYCGRVVKHVRVGPSPDWMRRRLRCAGLRPINNIVDITNYVMLELGQPMHAFDLDHLAGHQIIVRRAAAGETMRTLDRVDRQLDDAMLVIADRDRAVAIAGVMGAENSEITDATTTILFEAATFNPRSVRQTARRVGIRSEASARFEKGLDVCNASRALDRACELIEKLGAGEVCQGILDAWPVKSVERTVLFNPDSINAFLGTAIDGEWMAQTLEKLGISVVRQGQNYLAAIPSHRPDISGEADLAEEIARIFGYNRIEPSLLSGKQTTLGGRSPEQKKLERIKDLMIGQGFFEACTYSFESPRQMDRLQVPSGHPLRQSVIIDNPLGEDYSCMRTSMLPSLLEVASTNWNRSVETARVFEIAVVYQPKSLPLLDLPDENRHLSAFVYGSADQRTGATFYDLKGTVAELMMHLGIADWQMRALTDCPWLHPGQAAALDLGGVCVGSLGVIHPTVAANYGVSPDTAVLDLVLAPLLAAVSEKRQFKPLPRYPAVTRDLALIVDRQLPAGQLAAAIRTAAGENLEQISIFDVYEGPQVTAGKKSVAFSLLFRSAARTLSDEDIQPAMQNILDQLKADFQAVLR